MAYQNFACDTKQLICALLYSLYEISNTDITELTAPTIDFLDQFSQEVLKPISNMVGKYMLSNYPTFTKLINWKFKKRLQNLRIFNNITWCTSAKTLLLSCLFSNNDTFISYYYV